MRRNLIKTVYITFTILSIIFILKTVYLQAIEFIYPTSFESILGSIIASMFSISICIIIICISLNKLILKKE